MEELSEAAKRLIASAMLEEPPPGAEDGSWGTVVSRLTVEARPEPAAAQSVIASTPPAPASRRLLPIVAAIAIAVAVVAALAWPRPDAQTPAASPAARPPAPATPVATPPSKRTGPLPPNVAKTGPPPGQVAALLDQAEAAIAAKDGAKALALLERHADVAAMNDATRRMALRVLALCALGRVDAARDEGRALLTLEPDSSWAKRVRSSCAGG